MSFIARRPELVLALVTCFWASTFIVTKGIVRETPPLPYLTIRFAVGAAVLLAVFPRALRPSRRLARDAALLGALQALGLSLQVFGQVYTTASKSAFVTAFSTALTPMIALGLHGDRPTRPQAIGVVLASLGLYLLTWPAASTEWNRGDVLTGLCAIVYALAIVETARRARHADVGSLTALQTACATLAFALALVASRAALAALPDGARPELLTLEARPLNIDGKLLVQISYMALVCTAGTFLAQTWAMSRLDATHAAVVFALEPVVASGLAIAVEGGSEWPGPRGAVGASLVLTGIFASEWQRIGPGPRRT